MPQWLRSTMLRLGLAIPLLVLLSLLVFAFMDLAPGDAAERLAGENPTDEQIEAVRAQLDLDDPLPVRYLRWLTDAASGDLGESLSGGTHVSQMIVDRLPITMSLLAVSMTIALGLGLAGGIAASVHQHGVIDRLVGVISSVLVASPPFWTGLILVLLFAVERSWFPAVGYEGIDAGIGTWLSHLVLPGVALAGIPAAEVARQLRASLGDAMGTDYALAARAKGLSTPALIMRHGLRNAAVPVVTVLGFRVSQIVGSTVVVEQVFNIQGLGSLAVRSVLQQDVPVILGITMVTTLIVVAVNLLVDLSYPLLSPRMRTA